MKRLLLIGAAILCISPVASAEEPSPYDIGYAMTADYACQQVQQDVEVKQRWLSITDAWREGGEEYAEYGEGSEAFKQSLLWEGEDAACLRANLSYPWLGLAD